MRLVLSALACLLVVSGCSGKPDDEPATAAASGPAQASANISPPSAPPALARSERASNELYEFEYSYPVEAGAIPELKAWLDADLERQRRALIESARSALADSKENGYPFNPLGDWITWKVVTDLPGWLSLSADVGTYEGGAHPNHGFDALLWDRQANLRRGPLELFVSKQALSQAIRGDFCRALDGEREKRRGEPVNRASNNQFDQCIDPVENTVILGSSNRKAFDRIGVLVPPYNAGPYAEGDYEVTLPVSEAVLAAVRPEYRAAFGRGR